VRESSSLKVFAVSVAAAALAASTATSASSARKSVTLEVDRVFDDECYCYLLRFRGVISPRAGAQYVAVTQRKCGLNFATSVAGASTRWNGFWEVTSTVRSDSSATYWARWKGRLSKPVTMRPQMGIRLSKVSAKRYHVTVNTRDAQQKMAGRFVELQRLARGSWIRIRRARLAAEAGLLGTFSATFSVRTRGLKMRVVVPKNSAAPCFKSTISQTFFS
jgi:hypothetical protein